MKVKEVQEIFNAMNGEDEVWLTYITKDDLAECFDDMGIEDEATGDLIKSEAYATNEALKMFISGFDGEEYLWNNYGETFNEVARAVIEHLMAEKKEATSDEELWDTEGEASGEGAGSVASTSEV